MQDAMPMCCGRLRWEAVARHNAVIQRNRADGESRKFTA